MLPLPINLINFLLASDSSHHVVIVGGGWAGFTAAEELSKAFQNRSDRDVSYQVTMLDASQSAGGLAGGYRTDSGRPADAGIHGFWREYKNTFEMIENIDGLTLDEVLTEYTPSILVSKSGRVALAPVVGEGSKSQINISEIRSNLIKGNLVTTIASLLPPPLDLALLADVAPGSTITPFDRISGIGLLGAWADFGQEDRHSWDIYDKFSADELFRSKAGVTERLYDEFISPLLHVLPMTPGYDCSAAAALSCFHVFALQSKGAFDVRWGRGSLSELIFKPWIEQLTCRGNFQIKRGTKVESMDKDIREKTSSIVIKVMGENEPILCDSVILAVGATSCAKLVSQSKYLRELESTAKFNDLRGVTCVAVRLFLEPNKVISRTKIGSATQLPPSLANAMNDSPVVVVGPKVLPELEETGFCIYDLQRMHDEFSYDAKNKHNEAVIEVDFFRANSLALKENDEIVKITLRAISAALGIEDVDPSLVVDSAIIRARDAVSHFDVGSASISPGTELDDNIYICGDWVDRSGHASWSTEKAVVTGKQAARKVLRKFKMNEHLVRIMDPTDERDELKLLRTAARFFRNSIPPPVNDGGIPPSPWKLIQSIFSQ